MLAEPGRSSATDRLNAVHAQAVIGKLKAVEARQTREYNRHLLYAFVGWVLLTASLGIGMQQGWLPTSLLSVVMKPLDPAAEEFERTRAGQIRTPIKGDTCREITFDNDSGRLAGGDAVRCQQEAEDGQHNVGTGGRINAIRDSFRR